jgi:trk system potassium uptake protein TrkA
VRIVIAGCGRVGSDLALGLAEGGHDVSVVDHREGVFRDLGTTFNGTTHFGVAYDIEVLREAGIEFADAFVAVTNSDNANLMSVQIAKQVFGVPHTIARLDDPARAESYRALDIHYVAGAKLTSKVIREQLVDEEFRYHVTFSAGEVEITEVVLGDRAAGLKVSDIEIKDELRVAAVQRRDVVYVARPDFELRPGDLLVAATKPSARGKVRRYLRPVQQENTV